MKNLIGDEVMWKIPIFGGLDLSHFVDVPRNVFEYSTRFGLQSYETFQFVRDNDRDQTIYPARRRCHVSLLWSQIFLAVSQDDAKEYQCAGGGP